MNLLPAPLIKPIPWLTELARTKPAKWQWNRAIRAAICIGLPLGLGMLTGQMAIGVWMSIASLMVTASESNASYRSRLKAVAISIGIGSLGCLVGYIGLLPWAMVVPIMALLAFLAGIISSYGAPFSAGMLQFLALAAVALGRPQIAPFWEPMLFFLTGGLFYALMLILESLLLHLQPRRQMAVDLVNALAKLALSRAEGIEQGTGTNDKAVEDNRRAVTTLQSSLYADILGRHARKAGRTSEIDSLWAMLQSCDDVFAALLSTSSSAQLRAAATDLSVIAAAIVTAQKFPAELNAKRNADDPSALEQAIIALASSRQWSHSPFSPIVSAVSNKRAAAKPRLDILLDKLLPGRETLRSSAALALCVAISYIAHWFDKDVRWYWVPLTVAIIMKPDFGSIFARSLSRTAGTLGGALLGTIIMILLPKGIGLVVAIAALASLMPWAAQRSYATLGIIITPLVLVLIDLTVPGSINVNYGGQRLLSTAIGAGIVLIFGYFIWPRTHSKEISENFQRANRALSAYLLAATRLSVQDADTPLPKLRRIAYANLTDLRTQLQKTMAEPPPAGSEATAWLPIVASAERICDSITGYSVHTDAAAQQSTQALLRSLASAIAAAPAAPPERDWEALAATLPADDLKFAQSVANELRFINRSTESSAAHTNESSTMHSTEAQAASANT